MNPALAHLQELFSPLKAALKHRVAFVLDDGEAQVMDPRAPSLFTPGFRRDCDLTVLTNQATLMALLDGSLDPSAPQPGQLFAWGGDPEVFSALSRGLTGVSALALRSRESTGARS